MVLKLKYLYLSLYIIGLLIFSSGLLNAQSADTLNHLPKLSFDNPGDNGYPIDENQTFYFEKPSALQHFANAPGDLFKYTVNSFQSDNIKHLVWMTTLTAVLVIADQDLLDGAKRIGKKIGVKGENNVTSIADVFGFPIQMPTDFSSSLYFIGDGWTHTSITSSFLLYGFIDNDNRALQTASQLAQGLLTVTIATQFLKHITGRQSPIKSTQPGGRWDLFPNQVTYHKNVPAYDAFPSGHLCSAMMMVTVISENYKEYKYIKPLGYTLMTILAFQMMNNGVHWASDYPLALAMGYSLGMLASSQGKIIVNNNQHATPIELGLQIGMVGSSAIGISTILYF